MNAAVAATHDPAPDIVIDVHGLTKSFGGRVVVRDLSMQVKRGTIFGFLGPNGSGKTTTIRMLCGLLTPDQGSGTCLGYDIRTEVAKIKTRVGYMTQRFSLYEDLSVRENLEFIARIYGMPHPVAAAKAMIERLGLQGREEQVAAAYPLKRLGVPEDIAGVVAFLLSDQASWVTGQTVVLDGGVTLTGGV